MTVFAQHMAGSGPGLRWKRNVGRRRRSIEDARNIAFDNGVIAPDYVEFLYDPEYSLAGSWNGWFNLGHLWQTAQGPNPYCREDGYVYWEDFFHPVTRWIAFKLHSDVLTSDEAIVAVFTHELYELSEIRESCVDNGWRMHFYDYNIQVSADVSDSFHCIAWDVADAAVVRMRG